MCVTDKVAADRKRALTLEADHFIRDAFRTFSSYKDKTFMTMSDFRNWMEASPQLRALIELSFSIGSVNEDLISSGMRAYQAKLDQVSTTTSALLSLSYPSWRATFRSVIFFLYDNCHDKPAKAATASRFSYARGSPRSRMTICCLYLCHLFFLREDDDWSIRFSFFFLQ